ncbi:peptidase M23 [Synergistales bacterium]|nr:peptidase M23 [Synergistales bacterium]
MTTRKKTTIITAIALTLMLVYSCVSYAAKSAGSYWSGFDSDEGSVSDLENGYIVVDAIDPQNENDSLFYEGEYSFASDDVTLDDEEPDESEPETAGTGLASGDIEISVDSQYWIVKKVRAGETLSKIADDNHIPIKDIMTANELTNQHRIREGQILYVPKSSDRVAETLSHVRHLKAAEIDKRKTAKPFEITNYEIKNGDTLWSVANAFKLDVNSIFGCNKLSESTVLKVGNTIRIPNQDGVLVKVKQGQTVEKLARDYGIFEEAILSANKLSKGETLVAGKEIFLPGVKVASAPDSGTSGTAKKTFGRDKITAKRGFGWPVMGKLSSRFGWRRSPFTGRRTYHAGIDISAPRGRAIVASAAGRVVHAGWLGGYGRAVVISHPGGVTTLYGHCSKVLVRVGKNVRRGERIALVGSTGRSTGNHVHFEVRYGGTPTNPLRALR